MLKPEENELLTRTGPGTPMGELFRRYWIPVLLAQELPEADCPPIRVRLLGEDLVAFRDTAGRCGLLDAHCPHRGASLFFGRSEESGLRCVYHGWKFDVDGSCVDMPNEPAESNFKDRIHQKAYRCEERGGLIWAYMGPPHLTPELPELEWAMVPAAQRSISKRFQRCNYLQALEGGIDSGHIPFLHRDQYGSRPLVAGDTAPAFEVQQTDYGMQVGVRRNVDQDRYYWRVTQWVIPWHTMIPPFEDNPLAGHAWVPIDDESCWNFTMEWHPFRPLTSEELGRPQAGEGLHAPLQPGTFVPLASRENDYFIDRDLQRSKKSFSGIRGIAVQDDAIQESMGTIFNRSQEHLVGTDMAIATLRQRLMRAAEELLQEGADPPGLDPVTHRIRPAAVVLARDIRWTEGAQELLVAGGAARLGGA